MSKKAKIELANLSQLETEFSTLLVDCLTECANGRWGLFGQNAEADPEDRYWTWPEAKRLRSLAAEIQSQQAANGRDNPLCDRLLQICAAKGANTLGEPRLAGLFLTELEQRQIDAEVGIARSNP